MHKFPIDSLRSEILSSLDENDFLIIKSTPGSGKTTRVPIFLSEKYKKKIYVLEPRRLAAKLASGFVAASRGEKPGKSVGHIFKYDKSISEETQIIFLTEGTFLRILSEDTNLEECDVVILDEFHERHFYTDVSLSFLLKIKEKNKKLKVIIMSATINLDELERNLLGNVKIIELNERKYELEIRHLPNDTLILKEPLERKVYEAILSVKDRQGHILIFLSGMFEIRKCEEMLKRNFDFDIIILHSELSSVEIDESFSSLNKKKVILSTNIAESSVTIPGVRVVIDSGLHKIKRLNPITRLPLLELKKISQSSAIQRANRAAREDHGIAIRLYAEFDYLSRSEFDSPEITRSDLSELILTSADFFHESLDKFSFVTPLDSREVDKSKKYLEQVGLLENDELTKTGRNLSKTPFHPRIAKILHEASKGDESSFLQLLKVLSQFVEPKNPERFKSMARKYFCSNPIGKKIDFEKLFLFGYVDQLAKIKGGNQLIHTSGEIYTISHSKSNEIDSDHQLWIILDIDNKNQVTSLFPIEEAWLYDLPHFPIEEREKIEFDADTLKFNGERVTAIGAIVLAKEKVSTNSLSAEAIDFAARKLLPRFHQLLDASKFSRLYFLEKYSKKKIADYDLHSWLKEQVPFLITNSSFNLDLILDLYVDEIFHYLNDDNFDLDKDLPLSIKLNDKREVPLHYNISNGIHCESYIQDFYGLKSTPIILRGNEKIKVHLLGPHKRALQVTQDLESFWIKVYKDLFQELKRDYPRHYWPLDPMSAKPILLLRNVT